MAHDCSQKTRMIPTARPVAFFLRACLLLACGCAFTQSQRPSSVLPNESPWAQPGISPDELQRLHPVVLPELAGLLRRHYNENPSPVDVENEFQRCEFTPVSLGTLGRAIVVEAQTGRGKTNAGMLNIYVPNRGSYRRILEGMGFGPMILHGARPVPDLAFGLESGACHTKYFRYRYKHGKYVTDACYQEDRPADWNGGSCQVKRCDEHLPKFSDPALGP